VPIPAHRIYNILVTKAPESLQLLDLPSLPLRVIAWWCARVTHVGGHSVNVVWAIGALVSTVHVANAVMTFVALRVMWCATLGHSCRLICLLTHARELNKCYTQVRREHHSGVCQMAQSTNHQSARVTRADRASPNR